MLTVIGPRKTTRDTCSLLVFDSVLCPSKQGIQCRAVEQAAISDYRLNVLSVGDVLEYFGASGHPRLQRCRPTQQCLLAFSTFRGSAVMVSNMNIL